MPTRSTSAECTRHSTPESAFVGRLDRRGVQSILASLRRFSRVSRSRSVNVGRLVGLGSGVGVGAGVDDASTADGDKGAVGEGALVAGASATGRLGVGLVPQAPAMNSAARMATEQRKCIGRTSLADAGHDVPMGGSVTGRARCSRCDAIQSQPASQ